LNRSLIIVDSQDQYSFFDLLKKRHQRKNDIFSLNFLMKKLVLFALFLFPFIGFSQLTGNRFNVNAKFSVGQIDTAFFINPALTAEIIIHNRFGLNYNLDILRRNDNVNQTRVPMGLIGGPIVMLVGAINSADGDTTNGSGFGVVLGLLMLALPDGVSFHQPLGYRGDISPYVNVLGIDFIRNKFTDDRSIKYSCSFGVKGSYLLKDHFLFSAFVEGRKTAGIPLGFGGGVGVGYAFKKRN
jgi:hypothetical protein